MKTVCVWGDTRQDVEVAYGLLAEEDNPPQRVTWRLTSSFDGTLVGDECFAPFNSEIRDAYEAGGVIPQVDEVAGNDEDDEEYVETDDED